MKKLKSNLFEKKETLKSVSLDGIYGGGNKSDQNYADSKIGGSYDVALNSMADIVKTKRGLDKP